MRVFRSQAARRSPRRSERPRLRGLDSAHRLPAWDPARARGVRARARAAGTGRREEGRPRGRVAWLLLRARGEPPRAAVRARGARALHAAAGGRELARARAPLGGAGAALGDRRRGRGVARASEGGRATGAGAWLPRVRGRSLRSDLRSRSVPVDARGRPRALAGPAPDRRARRRARDELPRRNRVRAGRRRHRAGEPTRERARVRARSR